MNSSFSIMLWALAVALSSQEEVGSAIGERMPAANGEV
jgi:hypothetical protein